MNLFIDSNIFISAFLRAAIFAKAEIFLTGDRDFLDAGIKKPKIISAAEFLEMFSA